MTIEVFQWRVLRHGQINQAVSDLYSEIMRGKTEQIEAALADAHQWDERGLVLVKVAEVTEVPGITETPNRLERAFELTNNIEHSWTRNEGVVALGTAQHRSTSVGDLMRVGFNLAADGSVADAGWLYVVAPMGFKEIKASVPAAPSTPPTPSAVTAATVRMRP